MTQTDILSPSVTTASISISKQRETARRLLVLIPTFAADHIPAIHRICELANEQHAQVLLLSFCKNRLQESSLRRGLSVLRAMLQDGGVLAEINVEVAANWIEVVKRNYRSGDTVIYFSGPRAGVLHKPLNEILQSDLKVPIYVIAASDASRAKSNWISQITVWLGFMSIMAGSFMLQVNITQISKGTLQSVLLILSVIPEFWLLLFWNNQIR